MNNFEKIMNNNKAWSQKKLANEKDYFKRHSQFQRPKYLFIGCSDSRIPAETILGLEPGEIFVHRNVANQVSLSDINTMSVIQFAVEVLKVQDIIVTGHYGCGGVKAAFKRHDFGVLQSWLCHIRNTRIDFRELFNKSEQQNENLLCELNVKAQVYDIAKVACVQKAWVNGQKLRIHGLIYRLDNGVLNDLGLTLDRLNQIPEEHWIYECSKKKLSESRGIGQQKRGPTFKIFEKQNEEEQKPQNKNDSQILKTILNLAPLVLVAGAAFIYASKQK